MYIYCNTTLLKLFLFEIQTDFNSVSSIINKDIFHTQVFLGNTLILSY